MTSVTSDDLSGVTGQHLTLGHHEWPMNGHHVNAHTTIPYYSRHFQKEVGHRILGEEFERVLESKEI